MKNSVADTEDGTQAKGFREQGAEEDTWTSEGRGNIRKLHNKELYALHSSPNIILLIESRTQRWTGHVAYMGREEVHMGFWWEKLRGKRPFERPRRRWKNNIKRIFKQWGGGMDWIDLAQDRDRWRALVNAR